MSQINQGVALLTINLACIFLVQGAIAQITPDNTLGAESSFVTQNIEFDNRTVNLIQGGALRDKNLFHSFLDFNIDAGKNVYFDNPAAIQSIFSRVTGNNVSEIFGTLGVAGNADLFLLNPNGILFGENATLDVAGSFLATTAEKFDFGDDLEFSAINPQTAPLLTVTLEPGLQAGVPTLGNIVNEGTLKVGQSKNLSLWGKDVINRGTLVAPSGSVQILGERLRLDETTHIDVTGFGNAGQVLIGGEYQGQGILPTAQQLIVEPGAVIQANGFGVGDGGEVILWADHTTQFGGNIESRGGSLGGDGGFVEVSGAQSLQFNGLVDTSSPLGETGTLLLDPTNINIIAGTSPVFGAADGIWNSAEDPGDQNFGAETLATLLNNGNLILEATDQITIASDVNLNSPNSLTLIADKITNQNDSSLIQTGGGDIFLGASSKPITSISFSGDENGDGVINGVEFGVVGNSGNISVYTSFLELADGGVLATTNNGNGTAGDIIINATNSILLNKGAINAELFENGIGEGGNIQIKTNNLTLNNESVIFSSTSGQGDAGDTKITVLDTIKLDASAISSGVDPDAVGNGGDVMINSSRLIMTNNSGIDALVLGRGQAGQLNINATEEIQVDKSFIDTGIFAQAIGDGGDLNITTKTLKVINDSRIAANTFGIGNAGKLDLLATESIQIENSSILSDVFPNLGDNLQPILQDFFTSMLGPNFTIDEFFSLFESRNAEFDLLRLFLDEISVADLGQFIGDVSTPGTGGNIEIESKNINLNNAEISASTYSNGLAGAILVNTENLNLEANSLIQTNTFSSGNAGETRLNVTNDLNINNSSIEARTGVGSTGNGGDIKINHRGANLANSRIAVDSKGSGTGGDISVGSNFINLSNSAITTETFSSDGGNIFLDLDNRLFLEKASNVTATAGLAQQAGNGGNITVAASSIVASPNEDSNIFADAFSGLGGRIFVSVDKLVNIGFQTENIPVRNDITASSIIESSRLIFSPIFSLLFGGLPGSVIIESDIEDDRELPETLIDPSELIDRRCIGSAPGNASEFRLVGRGGRSPQPTDIFDVSESLEDIGPSYLQTTNENAISSPPQLSTNMANSEIAGIDSWHVTENGIIQLRTAIAQMNQKFVPHAISNCRHPELELLQ